MAERGDEAGGVFAVGLAARRQGRGEDEPEARSRVTATTRSRRRRGRCDRVPLRTPAAAAGGRSATSRGARERRVDGGVSCRRRHAAHHGNRCSPRPHRRPARTLRPLHREDPPRGARSLSDPPRQAHPHHRHHADDQRRGQDGQHHRPDPGAGRRSASTPWRRCASRRSGRCSGRRAAPPAAARPRCTRSTRSTCTSTATSTPSPRRTTCWRRCSTRTCTSATSCGSTPRRSCGRAAWT